MRDGVTNEPQQRKANLKNKTKKEGKAIPTKSCARFWRGKVEWWGKTTPLKAEEQKKKKQVVAKAKVGSPLDNTKTDPHTAAALRSHPLHRMDKPMKEEDHYIEGYHREEFGHPWLPFNNIYTNQEINNSFHTPFNLEPSENEFQDMSSTFSYMQEGASSFKYSNLEETSAAIDHHPIPVNEANSYLGDVQLSVVEQPPVEVRTRTPNEKRTFGCAVFVNGDYQNLGATHIAVELAYARPISGERPEQKILGGNKLVKIGGGLVPFDDLSMCEASTKHKGSEFCLEFFLASADGHRINQLHFVTSRPFYAYSNQKVLARRRNVDLRALSRTRGSAKGGDLMHVIGSPFISSPSLQVRVSTAHGEVSVNASSIEIYSESVLFFPLPAYPLPPPLPDGLEMRAQVRVSNDGRHFSNPIEFTYYVENDGPKRLRSRF